MDHVAGVDTPANYLHDSPMYPAFEPGCHNSDRSIHKKYPPAPLAGKELLIGEQLNRFW